jgi:DNA-directed RNA polymerase subunit M
MMFCPKCRNLLLIKKDGNKKILACPCGYKETKVEDKPKIKETVKKDTKELEVIDDKTELSTLPQTSTECPKCKHGKAYFWTVQTRASDEPETKFLKCEKCGHTWRDYN